MRSAPSIGQTLHPGEGTPGAQVISHAPDALVWVHANVTDGFTDLYGFGGFKTSGHLQTMADLEYVSAELP
jgi:hypothetical protein